MTLHIHPELERRIEQKMQEGFFHSADEVIAAGLELIEAQAADKNYWNAVNLSLQDGMREIDAGIFYTAAEAKAKLEEQRKSRIHGT